MTMGAENVIIATRSLAKYGHSPHFFRLQKKDSPIILKTRVNLLFGPQVSYIAVSKAKEYCSPGRCLQNARLETATTPCISCFFKLILESTTAELGYHMLPLSIRSLMKYPS